MSKISSITTREKEVPVPAVSQCRFADIRTGVRCKRKTQEGRAYCEQHRTQMPQATGISSTLMDINPHVSGPLGSAKSSHFPQRDKR